MASPTRVATSAVVTKTSGTTLNVSLGSPSDGNLLLVAVVHNNNGGTRPSISSTGFTNTWSLATSAGAAGHTLDVWTIEWATGDNTTAVVTTTSDQSAGVSCEVSGQDTTTPVIDADSTYTAAAGNPDPPANSHTSADVLSIAIGGADGKKASYTAPTNYTNLTQGSTNNDGNPQNANIAIAFRGVTSSTGEDPGAFTLTAAEAEWVAATIAIQEQAAILGSFTADAVIKKTQSGSVTADAVIKATITDSWFGATPIDTGTSAGIGFNATYQRRSQSFTPVLTSDLISLKYSVHKSGSPTDNLIIELYSDSGGEPDTLITTLETIAGADVPSSATVRTVHLSEAVTAGTKYWITWRRSGAVSGTDYFLVSRSLNDDYPGGNGGYYNGSSWGDNLTIDYYFEAQLDVAAVTADAVIAAVTTYYDFVCGGECDIHSRTNVLGDAQEHWAGQSQSGSSTWDTVTTPTRWGHGRAHRFIAAGTTDQSDAEPMWDSSETSWYMRFSAYFGTDPSTFTNDHFLAVVGGSDVLSTYYGIAFDDSEGTVRAAAAAGSSGSGGVYSSTNDFTPSQNTWYDFEAYVDGANKVIKWRYRADGGSWSNSETVTGTGTALSGSNNYNALGSGLFSGTGVANSTVYVDDAVAAWGSHAEFLYDTTGTNGRDGTVTILRPDSDGTHSFDTTGDFTKSGTNASSTDTDLYSHLDAADMQQASEYVAGAGAAANEYIEVNFEDSPEGFSDPQGMNAVLKGDNLTSGDFTVQVSDDGSTWSEDSYADTNGVWYAGFRVGSVGFAPSGAALTTGVIDSMRARVVSDATDAWRLYGLGLEVEYGSYGVSGGSFTADAVIEKSQSGSFAADAVIKKTIETKPPTVYDDFDRTENSDLGTSTSGHDYTNDTADWTVSPDEAQATVVQDEYTDLDLRTTSGHLLNARSLIRFRFSVDAVGEDHNLASVVRAEANGLWYMAESLFRSDGTIDARVRGMASGFFGPFALTEVGAWTDLTTEEWWQEVDVKGGGYNTVEFRIWKVGEPRPDTPQVSYTETRTTNDGAGGVGFWTWTGCTSGLTTYIDQLHYSELLTFAADAFIVAAVEDSFATDAVIEAPSGTQTFDIDAVIEKTQTSSTTADAILGTTTASSFAADAILLVPQSAAVQADAVVERTSEAAFFADAILSHLVQAGATLDAAINVVHTYDFSVDAVLLAEATDSTQFDAIILSGQAGDFTLEATMLAQVDGDWLADAVIAAGVAETFQVAATIRGETPGAFDVDGVVLASSSDSLVVEAVVERPSADTTQLDATILGQQEDTGTLDAVVFGTVDDVLTLDAAILRVASQSFQVDAWLLLPSYGGTFEIDAVVQRTHAASLTADAWVEGAGIGAFATDAIVLGSATDSFLVAALIEHTVVGADTADAVVQALGTGQESLDAIVLGVGQDQFDVEAIVLGTQAGDFADDAVIRAENGGSYTAEATILGELAGVYDLDAVVLGTQSGSSTADGVLRGTESGLGLVDAVLHKENAASTTVDSVVEREQTSSTTAAAWIELAVTDSFAADAVVHHVGAGSFLAQCWIEGAGLAAFSADAAILVPQAASFGVDAVVARTGLGTFDAEAMVLAVQAGQFGADAVVERLQGGSFELDAVVTRQVVDVASADAVFARVQTDSLVVDAWLERTISDSITVDAIFTKPTTGSFLAQCWIEGAGIAAFSADAVKLAEVLGSSSADAVVLREAQGSGTADGVVAKTNTGSLQADAAVLGGVVGSYVADALLTDTQTSQYTADAILGIVAGDTFTADAVIVAGTQEASFAVDAVVLRPQAGSFTAGSWVAGSGIGAFTADAALLSTATSATSIDAVLERTESDSLVVEAAVLGPAQGALPVGAIVEASQNASTVADAIVLASTTDKAFTADAVTVREQFASFTAGAWVEGAGVAAFAADAVVLAQASATIDVSAVVVASATGTFTADAQLKTVSQASLTADAVLEATRTGGFATDAVFLSPETGTFPVDARISLLVGGGSYPLDAVLLSQAAGSTAADALILSSTAGSFSADAQITIVAFASFPLDANITGAGQATFSVDAAIAGTTQGVGTIDASITRLIPEEIEATFSAATIAGTVTAATIEATSAAQTIDAEYTVSLTFVQGDTSPDITAIIHEEDDTASVIDLTGASVKFQMREAQGRRYRVNAAATLTDAAAGAVSYSWGPNDLAQHGTFIVQWEVTYPGGRIQTTSPEVEITVRRQ
jgi:hypothetical protein